MKITKIKFSGIIYQKNPNFIHVLEKNIDKIDWNFLLSNPNAIRLLKQKPKKNILGVVIGKS